MVFEVILTRPTWRFLLVCFLLVALSFQGVARAGMIAFGQDHHCHGLQMESAPDEVKASLDDADHHHLTAASAKAKTFQDKCNHCAPCCIGAAMLTESAFQIAAPVATQDFAPLSVAKYSTDRGRLDRPPQAFLT
jgi:hypothetical protein